jgi:hypothetical protein
MSLYTHSVICTIILYLYYLCINVYVLFIVYVTLPPSISPIAVGIIYNNNNNNNIIFHVLLYWWPPLWSSDQNCWPHFRRSGLNSRRYQIFWEVVGLQRGPLGLMSILEELFGRNSSGSGLEMKNMAVGIRQSDKVISSISKIWH